MGLMKVTIEIPDELYRQVKARSALEGRPVREVTEALFRRFVHADAPSAESTEGESPAEPARVAGEPPPKWFGSLRRYARRVPRHDLDAIRESIARSVSGDRS